MKTLIKLSEVLEFNFLSRDETKMINQETFYPDTMSLSDLRKKYLDYLVHAVSYKTYKRYKCVIDELISIVGNVKRVQLSHLEYYRLNTTTNKTINGVPRKVPRSIEGIATNLNQIKIMIRWGERMDYIDKICPFPRLNRPRPKPKRILSNDQIRQILTCDKMDAEDKKLVKLYLNTGARATEFLKDNFTWDHYDAKNLFGGCIIFS